MNLKRSKNAMRRSRTLVVFAGLLISIGGMSFVVTAQQQKPAAADASQIRELQKEQIETLEELVKIALTHYNEGRTTFESVASAENELVGALLNSTDKREERIELLTRQLEVSESILKIADARFKNGGTTIMDVHRAKSLFFGVKIRLLQEKQR
jgi:outer membrane protein TolC